MKLLMEQWKNYLNESPRQTYYWQTTGAWSGKDKIRQGSSHVPRSNPRSQGGGRVEEIFEEVRKEQFPERPSRLDCVYLCENLDGPAGESFCSYPARDGGETYEIRLEGDYNLFKTNSEYWTEAVTSFSRGDEDKVRGFAEAYWEGDDPYMTLSEILVSPPESAIIERKI